VSAADPRRLVTASRSDVGRVRSENQDACAEWSHASGARLLLVADGMGGHRGGSTASRLAVEAVGEVFAAGADDPEATLRRAFAEANARILRRAEEEPRLSGMGTTGVALLFAADGSAFVAHVGDSRAYRIRGGAIQALTADHSVVAELMRVGMLRPDEAEEHPGRHTLLRALGTEDEVKVDVARVDARPGDRFVLCSDGLSGVVSDEEIARLLSGNALPGAVEGLVALANERGGPDNVTVSAALLPGAQEGPGRRAAPRAGRRRRGLALLALGLVLLAGSLLSRGC
jgi:protein phosphatase